MISGRNKGVLFMCALLLGVTSGATRADEFSVVAAGDAAYGHLSSLSQTGWLDSSTSLPKNRPSGAAAASVVTKNTTLTRYEMALQTARAIFVVSARSEADANWTRTASKPAARALRELTNTFRAELRGMGVDVVPTLKNLDAILQGTSRVSAPRSTVPAVRSVNRNERFTAGGSPGGVFSLPLSQRLRVDAAVTSLARDAADPFGDAAFEAAGNRNQKSSAMIPGAIQNRAGLALGVTDWLTLRAGYANRTGDVTPTLANSSAAFAMPFGAREMGGGVEIALPRGLLLSGDVANVAGAQTGASSFTRMGGGVGWMGWQNRLSMKANLSRLVPGDARILPSTLVGLNVGLDVSERLSLTLRYQQMFSAPVTNDASRLVAGGVSLNF